MNLKVNNKEEQKYLKRTKIIGELTFDSAIPSRLEIQETLAKKEGAESDLVIIERVNSEFGDRRAEFEAYLYQDADSLKKVALPGIVKRHEKAKEKQAEAEKKAAEEKAAKAEQEAQAKEEASEEKPAEEAAAPAEEKKEE